jgi:hypothetical protein|tara:strand:- start:46 stop:480 length:435 start_codon:yes stop_codon:yes gene_type:complete
MKIITHILASLILAIILYPVFDWKAIFIFAGGVLIDIDHYLWYIFKYKKFNFFDCYRYCLDMMKKPHCHESIGTLLIFHSIELIMLIVFLSFYSEIVLAITIGILIHFLMDMIFLYVAYKRIIITNYSLILWIIKNRASEYNEK